jgi:hypothetical protein
LVLEEATFCCGAKAVTTASEATRMAMDFMVNFKIGR